MKPQDNHQDCSVSKELTKKPYQKPRLEVYGRLGEITRALGTMGKTDHHFAKFTAA